MEILTIGAKDIVQVNRRGMLYKDENGASCEIDFSQCRCRWAEAYGLKQEESTCVADRDAAACPMYFLFYSEPCLKVVFPYNIGSLSAIFTPRSKIEAYDAFSNFRKMIHDSGWTTFDLT